jgi:hypothetical protein
MNHSNDHLTSQAFTPISYVNGQMEWFSIAISWYTRGSTIDYVAGHPSSPESSLFTLLSPQPPSINRPLLVHLDDNTLATREEHVHLVIVVPVDGGEGATRVPRYEHGAATISRADVAVVNEREDRRDALATAASASAAQDHVDLHALAGRRVAENDPVDRSSERGASHHEDVGGKKKDTLGGANADGGNSAGGNHVPRVDNR